MNYGCRSAIWRAVMDGKGNTQMRKDYQKIYEEKKGTVQDCLDLIQSGDVIYATNNYSEPREVLSHLHEIGDRVENVKVWKGRVYDYPFMFDENLKGRIDMYTYFYGSRMYKESFPMGLVDFVPVDLAGYYAVAVASKPANVILTIATPMDENGMLYLGPNHISEAEAVQDAIDNHKTLIVEVNPNIHTMRGAQAIPIEAVTRLVEVDTPEYCLKPAEPTPVEQKIGQAVADLVNNGDTIQLGIGGIPNAVGKALADKRDLGIHTEMFTSSMMELIQAGAITGAKKNIDRGLHVCTFAEGVKELYPFLQENKNCVLRSSIEVANPFVIAQQNNMVSINTCVEIDLTGQVCAESIGPKEISGSGGAFAFALGAYHSKGGKGILAFPSRSAKGISKIKSILTPGAVVTTTRNYVNYIVTEYGVAKLKGASVRERAQQLIAIAHPEDREKLTAAAKALMYF